MSRLVALLLVGLTLAACGVDGEPIRPEPSDPGVSISGTARIGVAGGS